MLTSIRAKRYSSGESPAAIRHLEQRQVRGKVVICIVICI